VNPTEQCHETEQESMLCGIVGRLRDVVEKHIYAFSKKIQAKSVKTATKDWQSVSARKAGLFNQQEGWPV
jgi:hypothetical protein